MEEHKSGSIFICHQGLERSKAAADALREKLGLGVSHFPGGTQRLVELGDEEIRAELGESGVVNLIYDHGSSDREYLNKEKALEILRKLGIKPNVIDTADLAACLSENGIDINDYLF